MKDGEYRAYVDSVTVVVVWPRNCEILVIGTSACAIQTPAVCLNTCGEHFTPDRRAAASIALRIFLTGFSLYSTMKSVWAIFWAYCSAARARLFKGTVGRRLFVITLPAGLKLIVFVSQSTADHLASKIALIRAPVATAKITNTRTWGDSIASKSFSSSARVRNRSRGGLPSGSQTDVFPRPYFKLRQARSITNSVRIVTDLTPCVRRKALYFLQSSFVIAEPILYPKNGPNFFQRYSSCFVFTPSLARSAM